MLRISFKRRVSPRGRLQAQARGSLTPQSRMQTTACQTLRLNNQGTAASSLSAQVSPGRILISITPRTNQKTLLLAASSRQSTWWKKFCREIWASARRSKSSRSWLTSKIRKFTSFRTRTKTWENACRYSKTIRAKTATLKCKSWLKIRRCSSNESSNWRPLVTTGCKVVKAQTKIASRINRLKSTKTWSLWGPQWGTGAEIKLTMSFLE